MADQKISQLTAATTPLAGTEVLPIVQGSATKKVSIDNLTAGKAVAVGSLTSSGAVSLPNFTPLRFNDSGGTPRNALYLDASDNMQMEVNINNKDLVITTYGTGGVKIINNIIQGTAAKGINFTANTPAAGKTSQLLNWYEEGTFTPTVAGDATGVINTASGQYTRVGNVVYFRCVFAVTTNFTSGSIGGLPFTCAVNNGLTGLMGGSTVLTASNIGAPIIATPLNGSTNINFYTTASTATPHTPNTVNSIYRINGFYFV